MRVREREREGETERKDRIGGGGQKNPGSTHARTHALAQEPEESRRKEDDTFDDGSMQ